MFNYVLSRYMEDKWTFGSKLLSSQETIFILSGVLNSRYVYFLMTGREARMSIGFTCLVDTRLLEECLHPDVQIDCVGGFEGNLPPLWLLLLLLLQSSVLLAPPWQTLSPLPFPNRSCAPSTALNILLLLPSPWLTLWKSPQESYWRCQGSACDELELGSLQKGTCITCSVWDISLESAVGTQNNFCMETVLEKAGSKIQFRMGKPWLNTYWT